MDAVRRSPWLRVGIFVALLLVALPFGFTPRERSEIAMWMAAHAALVLSPVIAGLSLGFLTWNWKVGAGAALIVCAVIWLYA